jgi:rhomboid protease GluP
LSDERTGGTEPLLITPDMLARPAAARETRIDFERGMSYAPTFTLLMLFALVSTFVWQQASGALLSSQALLASGALTRSSVLAGEWWRMLSATMLHGGVEHLISNCVSLYILGMACEHAFGRRVALIYAASALGGSMLSMLLSPGPSVGASGAIFGLMGAIVVALTIHKDRFYVRDKRIATVIVVWAIYTLGVGLLTPYVDNGAHLGGLIAGMMGGRLTPTRI